MRRAMPPRAVICLRRTRTLVVIDTADGEHRGHVGGRKCGAPQRSVVAVRGDERDARANDFTDLRKRRRRRVSTARERATSLLCVSCARTRAPCREKDGRGDPVHQLRD